MQNSVKGFKGRCEQAGERITNLKIEQWKLLSLRNRKKRLKKNEQSLRDLRESQEKREKGAERIIKEIISENFPNLKKNVNINIQEAQ